MNFLKRFQFNRPSNASKQQASLPVESLPLEVGNAIDAFVSLEETAPEMDAMEVLASGWGMPHTSPTESNVTKAD